MSYAIILYGKGKSTICNTNCTNESLLRVLKTTCHEVCLATDQLDLADEYGECKYLSSKLEGLAKHFIAPRERLILVRVDKVKQFDGAVAKFVPLLHSARGDINFMSNLNKKATPRLPPPAAPAMSILAMSVKPPVSLAPLKPSSRTMNRNSGTKRPRPFQTAPLPPLTTSTLIGRLTRRTTTFYNNFAPKSQQLPLHLTGAAVKGIPRFVGTKSI